MKNPTGKDIIKMISRHIDEKEQIRHFFNSNPLKNAIVRHIADANDCVLLQREKDDIVYYRGLGPAITLKNWFLVTGGISGQPDSILVMDFVIVYCSTDNGVVAQERYTKEYSINVPVELVTDFTLADFQKFLDEKKAERDTLRRKEEVKLLHELARKYPEVIDVLSRE